MPHQIVSDPTTVNKVLDDFARTTEQIVTLDELRERLLSGRQIRIKYGVDVTAPQMHIGHAVNLWMMRRLQEIGHKVIFLVGDFTTQIGDPTGKNKTRPIIPPEEIEANAAAFIQQVGQILLLDDDVIEIRRNSEWFDTFPTRQFLGLLQMVTHDRLVSRDMFRRRLENNQEIYMHELAYPLIQGYDSVAIESDLTIIGSDQLFNEMMGRFYQERFGQKPQTIITTKITPGIDGKEKQSKSLGNYIGLDHSARDKFGRVMRIPDNLIQMYFEVYTEVESAEIARLAELIAADPMEGKKRLAAEIVARYHGRETAAAERRWFESVFSEQQVPEDIPNVAVSASPARAFEIVRACLDSAEFSNSQVKRLFQQGGVVIAESKVTTPDHSVEIPAEGVIVQIGRRKWFRAVRGN